MERVYALLATVLLAILVLHVLNAYAQNSTVEKFYESPFYRILSRINGRVFHVGDVTVCPGGCNATIAVRDIASKVTMVYRDVPGFTMRLYNATLMIIVEPLLHGFEVNETIVNCYFNASRVELTAPNITMIMEPGSHKLYMIKPEEPVVLKLDGYRLVIRGFAFIVTPEALRKHQVETIDNRTVIFGFSTGIIPDATLEAGSVEIPIGYAHPYPAVIYTLFYNATRGEGQQAAGEPDTTVHAPQVTGGASASTTGHSAGETEQLVYPAAGAAILAIAAIAAYALAKKRT